MIMSQFILSGCSTADMPRTFFQEREIPFACYRYTIDGKVYNDDLGQSMPMAEFYRRIDEGAMPTTSQVNKAEFIEHFEPLLQAGNDVLHIEMSSGISGTYEQAKAAEAELAPKYPDRKIYVVDSLGASSGYGLLLDAAADRRDTGASIEEVRDWVEQNKLTVNHWFFTTDLTHFKRGGRISVASATFGSLFNICPLMNVDVKGKLIPRAKARGKKRVMAEMLGKMEKHAIGGTSYSGKCFISNAARFDDARQVADMVETTFPNLNGKVMINDIGTVIGAHTGPGTVALFFFGDPRVD